MIHLLTQLSCDSDDNIGITHCVTDAGDAAEANGKVSDSDDNIDIHIAIGHCVSDAGDAAGATDGDANNSSDNSRYSDEAGPATKRPRVQARGRAAPRGRARGTLAGLAAARAPARGRGTQGQAAAGGRSRDAPGQVYQWIPVHADDPGPRELRFTPIDNPGPQHVDGLDTPYDFFQCFINDEVLQYLVNEIKEYAKTKLDNANLKPRSRLRNWVDTDIDEMKRFIGIILNMGIIQAPTVEAYWRTDWESSIPFFRGSMVRDRLQLLYHTMLHAAHRNPDEEPHRGDKIQPLLDMILAKFQHHFVLFDKLSSDESMIGFKGRVSFRQYIPKKPTKWGILAKTLADSATGYMLNIRLYYSRDDSVPETDDGLTKTSRTVVKLADPYLEKGYHIFADRLYTSVDLAETLYKKRTYLTGTIQTNRRNLPPQLKEKMQVGDIRAFRSNNIMVLNWRDKRVVTMISTCYKGNLTAEKRVRGRDNLVRKPLVILRYNEFMGGVDLCDQYNQYYQFCRKSIKWWKKVFFWILETCITNSYILYKLTRPVEERGTSLLKFRRALVTSLVPRAVDIPIHRPGRPSLGPPLERLNGRFHGQELSSTKTDCKVCSKRPKQRRETCYVCTTCQGHPHLHPGTCFVRYHTLRNIN